MIFIISSALGNGFSSTSQRDAIVLSPHPDYLPNTFKNLLSVLFIPFSQLSCVWGRVGIDQIKRPTLVVLKGFALDELVDGGFVEITLAGSNQPFI